MADVKNAAPSTGAGGFDGKPARNPPWTFDEMILLMDLYRRAPRADKADAAVLRLSQHLNAMAQAQGLVRSPTYRNPVGIAMKLRNLGQQDPEFLKSGRTGLRNAGRLNAEVWRRFANDPIALAAETARILAGLPGFETPAARSSRAFCDLIESSGIPKSPAF
jgi:5-methylcytosine-specific restriction protein A